ncbi:hypothetical protein FACS1894219_00950 [Clostridia bacterium]|nr:hypothetical protein FACS1894219_00950 [Clostridia bacterium]
MENIPLPVKVIMYIIVYGLLAAGIGFGVMIAAHQIFLYGVNSSTIIGGIVIVGGFAFPTFLLGFAIRMFTVKICETILVKSAMKDTMEKLRKGQPIGDNEIFKRGDSYHGE